MDMVSVKLGGSENVDLKMSRSSFLPAGPKTSRTLYNFPYLHNLLPKLHDCIENMSRAAVEVSIMVYHFDFLLFGLFWSFEEQLLDPSGN